MNAEVFIRKLEAFGPISEDDQLYLSRMRLECRRIAAGKPFIKSGDILGHVHILLDGFACRYKVLGSGRRQISAFILPGDFCDAHSLILKAADHSITTLCDCAVAYVARDKLAEMLERPGIAKALLFSSLIEESILREWIGNLGQRNAVQKMAHLFCEMYFRMKIVGLVTNNSFELPLSQAELGDTLGLSLVHTNKSLRKLREQNLLTFRSGKLHVLDIAGLEKVCQFSSTYLHLEGGRPSG